MGFVFHVTRFTCLSENSLSSFLAAGERGGVEFCYRQLSVRGDFMAINAL